MLVKGEPARALDAQIGEQPVTLVPLPQTSAADLSFLVQVVLTGRLPGVERLDEGVLGRDVDIPVPVGHLVAAIGGVRHAGRADQLDGASAGRTDGRGSRREHRTSRVNRRPRPRR